MGRKRFVTERGWKIGETARRVGLTVRTLHHYDRIGLLSPSQYTESGHRLYSPADLKKLQQIVALKQLGFRLKEIKTILRHSDDDPGKMLQMQLSRIDKQIQALIGLRRRLLQIYEQYRLGKMGSGEQLLTVMRMMKMMQSPHFTVRQIRDLRERYSALENGVSIYAEGQRILAQFRECRLRGKPPEDPDVLALARRWKKEMDALALTDPQLVRSAERYYRENPDEAWYHGMDGDLYGYLKKALSLI